MMIGFMDCIKLNEWMLDDHKCSGFGDTTPPLPTDDDELWWCRNEGVAKCDPYGGGVKCDPTDDDDVGLSPVSAPSSDPGSHTCKQE
jgi:hypothetical protein